jgi:predicted Zn-dependent protease
MTHLTWKPLAAAIFGLAACTRPSYLGATLPHPCTAQDVEACLGWMVERDLADAELELYDDTALRDYVQSVADRLARGANLARAPRIVIADRDGTYATSGSRIVIARPTIERLDSEALRHS